jgi:hypothetical protein
MATHQESTAATGAAPPMPSLVGHMVAPAQPTSTDDAPAGSTVVSGLPHCGGGAYWDRAYGAYWSAYAAVAGSVADAARTAGTGLDDLTDPTGRVRASLSLLGEAARRAGTAGPHRVPLSADQSAKAEFPGALASDEYRPLVGDLWDGLRLRGAVDGALEGARDVIAGWRASVPRGDRMAGFGDGTVTDWVYATLAVINKEVVGRWHAGNASVPAATAGLNFAHPASVESAPALPGPAAATPRRSANRRLRT